MVIQVLIRLTLYIDQAIIRRAGLQFGNESSIHGIDNTVSTNSVQIAFKCLLVDAKVLIIKNKIQKCVIWLLSNF
jgi:hypothetical protein